MSDNIEYTVLFGLNGIIDSIDSNKYTYRQYIIDCFRGVFPLNAITDEKILWNSRAWTLSNKFRILAKDNADYDTYLLYYIEWVLSNEIEVTEEIHKSFVKITKSLFNKLIIYQDVIDYMDKLKKACKVGIVTDRDWFGCQVIKSYIDESSYDFVRHYWPSGYFKTDDCCWDEVADNYDKRKRTLIVDTSREVIDKVQKLGFSGYLHIEGDLNGLTKEVNKFLSNGGLSTQ